MMDDGGSRLHTVKANIEKSDLHQHKCGSQRPYWLNFLFEQSTRFFFKFMFNIQNINTVFFL